MHLEHGNHHRGQCAPRQTQCQQWDHRSTRCRIVCGFCGNHSLKFTFAEFLTIFGPPHSFTITHKRRQCGANTRQNTAEESNQYGTQDGNFMHPQFDKGRKCHADLGCLIFPAGFLFRLNENFRNGKEPQNCGDKRNASSQICHAEIVTVDATHGILANRCDQQTDQDRHPAFPNGARANRGSNHKTKEHKRKDFGRANIADRPIRQWLGCGHHDKGRCNPANGRT